MNLDDLFNELPINIQDYFTKEGLSPIQVSLGEIKQHAEEQFDKYEKKISELSEGNNDFYDKSIDYLTQILK